MSRLKRLIGEIHRRSLWQVLLIYVGAGWVVFEIVQTVTEGLGLPQWFPAFAALLLLIGLPVVLATAFVREGEPDAVVSDPTLMPVAEVLTEAARRRRLLTWRNAGLSFLVALAVWGVVATGWLLFQGRDVDHTSAVAEDRPSVAALPFVNRSGLEEDVYFTDGIHDEILTQLLKMGGLSVRGRTSVMQYRESPKNLRDIGQELNARYLLEGGVSRAGETVRINVQLIDAQRDEHVWAETYDRSLSVENLLAVQREVALRIADALKTSLTAGERQQVQAKSTDNLEAYEYYLRGKTYFWRVFGAVGAERRILADSAMEMYERSAIVLAAVGFLAVLVLAWYHGEKGWQRASGVELLILAGILVIAGAAVAVVGRVWSTESKPL